jgi:hypothetical protein
VRAAERTLIRLHLFSRLESSLDFSSTYTVWIQLKVTNGQYDVQSKKRKTQFCIW